MTRTLFLALALGLIAGGAAAAPAQFPLHKSDRWTYEVRTPFGSTTEKTVSVDSTYYSCVGCSVVFTTTRRRSSSTSRMSTMPSSGRSTRSTC